MKLFAFVVFIGGFCTACMGGGDADVASADPDGNVGFGGAQDIGQFRNILDAGGIPGENTFDANGFFSEHYTQLPAPDCGQILCVHGMLSVGRDWRNGDYQAALQVAMNTTVDPATVERRPLNLVVVVDTSGSMADEDRIGFVQEGLHLLVDRLEEGDRLAVVTYSSGVSVPAEFTASLDRPALHQLIDSLRAGGSTNIHDGLRTGFELSGAAFEADRQNRVILLSDGLATAGITDNASILDMAVEHIASGIGLTTIGVGVGFNVELMRGLAERGAGNFYFLEDAPAIREVFVDEIDYFVEPLAVSVRIEVTPGSAYRVGEVVGTRLWNNQGSSGSLFIPGVFLASRQSDTPDPNGRRGGGSALFIAMQPRQGRFDNSGQVARIRMTYRLPGSEEELEQVVVVDNPADPGVPPDRDIYLSHQAMAEHYAMYNIYLGLREATRLAARDYQCALSQLVALHNEIEGWNAEFEDPDIEADRQLVEQFIGNLEELGARRGDTDADRLCRGEEFPSDEVHDDRDVVIYGCVISADGAGRPAGWLVFALAVVIALRRRRTTSQ
ncbi:MAG: VWA domain-containing protein [Proteobacteria bacterium]|nr:VWA domain-containing protein [Pseudomonadota bacterium]